MRWLLICAVLLVLTGCPPTTKDNGDQPVTGDEYDRFGALMCDPVGSTDELKRLQGLVTKPPSLGYANVGEADADYTLGTKREGGAVGLTLTQRTSNEECVLWCWQASAPDQELAMVRDEESAGGYHLEFNTPEGLVVTIVARWTQGRFLQISRELMLGGLNQTLDLKPRQADWTLACDWLPYRMVPASHGPYGVVPDEQADGEWHSVSYPLEAMAPAVAAYDRNQALLLAVVDEHPRILDRRYELSYRIPAEFSQGDQLRISAEVYDPATDSFTLPALESGEALRESIVLVPQTLTKQSVDPTLVEAETGAVIRELGALSRAYYFLPNPPEPTPEGNLLAIVEWIQTAEELEDFINMAVGVWEAVGTEAILWDGAIPVGNTVGLGAADLPEGEGLAEKALPRLELIKQGGLPLLAYVNYLVFFEHDAYHQKWPSWPAVDAGGNYFIKVPEYRDEILLDIRNPEVAAWLCRKMAVDLKAYPTIAGYRFHQVFAVGVEGQTPEQGPYALSYPAAAALQYMRTAEAVRAARPDALLGATAGLRVGLPAFCNTYRNGYGNYDVNFGFPDPIPPLPYENRYSNLVFHEVFGVAPYISFGSISLSAQVIAATEPISGVCLTPGMQQYAGFEEFAANLRFLREAGGEIRAVYAKPESCSYTGGDERPAVVEQMIAVLPAKLSGATSVWVAFHGIGGSVKTDYQNNLTINWDGGSWTGKLPVGIWEVAHPTPEQVQPGDAVLVRKRPLAPMRTQGTETS